MQTQIADKLLSLQDLRQSASLSIKEFGVRFRSCVIEDLSIDRNRNSLQPQGKAGNRWITVTDGNDYKARICISPSVWQRTIEKGYRISDAVSIDVAIDELWLDNWCQLIIKAINVRVSGQSRTEARKQQIYDFCQEQGYLERPKRPLPFFVRNIAIITSRQSTIESDITKQIGLKKQLVHSYRFNGKADDLSALICKLANMNQYDLICLYRGGREDEAMFVYSDETVLNEIVQSPIPVVTALGHEQDTPPVQIIADKGYASPSRFAVEIKEHNNKARQEIDYLSWDIRNNFNKYLESLHNSISRDGNDIKRLVTDIELIRQRKKNIKKNVLIYLLILSILISIVFILFK